MAEYILDTTDGIMNAKTTGIVIRCKDCVWGRNVEQLGCLRFDDRASLDRLTDPYGYCAWAKEDTPWHARLGRQSR